MKKNTEQYINHKATILMNKLNKSKYGRFTTA